jgi:hypothetical protein
MHHPLPIIRLRPMLRILHILIAWTETVEEVVDTTAKLAGKRMRYMVLNEDIARPTSNRFAELEMGLDSQEIIAMFDSTWGNHYSPEKKPPT